MMYGPTHIREGVYLMRSFQMHINNFNLFSHHYGTPSLTTFSSLMACSWPIGSRSTEPVQRSSVDLYVVILIDLFVDGLPHYRLYLRQEITECLQKKTSILLNFDVYWTVHRYDN